MGWHGRQPKVLLGQDVPSEPVRRADECSEGTSNGGARARLPEPPLCYELPTHKQLIYHHTRSKRLIPTINPPIDIHQFTP